MAAHPAITISRSLGSGGTEVGFLLARKLGWRFCDRTILRQAAQVLGLTSAGLGPQEERYSGFLEQLFSLMTLATPEAPYTPPLDLPVYSRDLVEVERDIMRQIVRHYPAVLVGRGGFVALKDHPLALHVQIVADMAFRTQFLVDRGKAPDLEAARRLIEESDRNRGDFIRRITGLDWNDPRPFHLVLDSSRLGLGGCVARIAEEARLRSWHPLRGLKVVPESG